MVEIREVDGGYEVLGREQRHLVADRAKAYRIAQVVAIQDGAGQAVDITVPMGFGESVLVPQS